MPRDDLLIGRKSLSGYAYHVIICTHNRQPLFNSFHLGRIAVKHLRHLHEEQRLNSIAWVVMPDHLHLLFQLGESHKLSDVIKTFKARSAIEVNRRQHRRGQLWQRGYYDHALRREEDLKGVSRYIIANPLRAGLVEKVEDYPLWDAIWL